MPVLSIVVPFLNESESASAFVELTAKLSEHVKASHNLDLEVILVDDGSTDDSIARYMAGLEGKWKIVELSRNFGKEIALFAGIAETSGDFVMMMDADLQHSETVALQLIDELMADDKLDVVYTVRNDRHQESYRKEMGSILFYWLINFRQRFQVPANAGDFRIMRRAVAQALLSIKDKRRFNKGLYAWAGFKQKGIEYTPDERVGSVSRWSRLALIALSLEGITSFSVLPLRMFSAIGAMAGLFGTLYGIKIIFEVVFHGIDVPGYPSLMVAVSVLGGLNLALLGLVGEYLWVGVSEAKDRPLYIVRKVHTPGDKG